MALKKKVPEPYARVTRGSTAGTIVHFHKDSNTISVLPDDRPRSKGTVLWSVDDCRITRAAWKCALCGAEHSIFSCPKGV